MKTFYWVLIASLFLSTASYSHAQKLEDYSLKHSMKQDGLSMTFTVLDPDKKGIKRHSTEKIYYWYKAQKVIGTQGGNSGQLLHGVFESFYSSKQLCEKGSYSKGLKDGEWNYWHTNGTLLRKEQWNNGPQKGTQLFYDASGDLRKTTVIHGKNSRSQSGDSLIEISGKSKTITVFDSLGHVLSVARYKNSLLNGKQETISATGEKSVTTFKNGEVLVKTEKPKKEKEGAKASAQAGEKEGFFKKIKNRFPRKAPKEKTGKADKPKKERPAKEQKKTGLFKKKSA